MPLSLSVITYILSPALLEDIKSKYPSACRFKSALSTPSRVNFLPSGSTEVISAAEIRQPSVPSHSLYTASIMRLSYLESISYQPRYYTTQKTSAECRRYGQCNFFKALAAALACSGRGGGGGSGALGIIF